MSACDVDEFVVNPASDLFSQMFFNLYGRFQIFETIVIYSQVGKKGTFPGIVKKKIALHYSISGQMLANFCCFKGQVTETMLLWLVYITTQSLWSQSLFPDLFPIFHLLCYDTCLAFCILQSLIVSLLLPLLLYNLFKQLMQLLITMTLTMAGG